MWQNERILRESSGRIRRLGRRERHQLFRRIVPFGLIEWSPDGRSRLSGLRAVFRVAREVALGDREVGIDHLEAIL